MGRRVEGFDIIGDVHGCAVSLCILLDRLGYREINGVYLHPRRQVIFIGDIVDRGPHIRESLHIVRAMVEAGSAHIVMGNHEFNLVSYLTEAPDGVGYLREHTPRHNRILQETLEQFALYPDELKDHLRWMLKLPLFLEFENFRVVHACWHQALIDQFQARYGSYQLTYDTLAKASVPGSFEYDVCDRLLRGTHLPMPDGEVTVSKDGFRRHFFRTKFWAKDPQRLIDVVFQPDPLPEHIARRPITPEQRKELLYYPPDEKPLFIGHYWCEGEPKPVSPNIACIDFSAVKFGKLVAYRFDNETQLSADKFVWVDVAREINQPD